MSDVLVDLGTALDAATALTLGTDLFLDVLPEAPSDAVALVEVPGPAPVDAMGTGVPPISTPRVQVLSRATHPATGKATALVVWNALAAIAEGLVGGGDKRVLRVQVDQSPFLVGRDGNDRAIFGFNCQVWRDS